MICNETFGELQCLGTNLSFCAVFGSPDGPILTCQGFHLHPISGQSVQSAGSLNHLSHLRLCFIGSLSSSKAVPHHPKLIVKLRNEAKKLSPPWSESVIDLVAHSSMQEAWCEIQPSHGSVWSIEFWRNSVTFPYFSDSFQISYRYASHFDDLVSSTWSSFLLFVEPAWGLKRWKSMRFVGLQGVSEQHHWFNWQEHCVDICFRFVKWGEQVVSIHLELFLELRICVISAWRWTEETHLAILRLQPGSFRLELRGQTQGPGSAVIRWGNYIHNCIKVKITEERIYFLDLISKAEELPEDCCQRTHCSAAERLPVFWS